MVINKIKRYIKKRKQEKVNNEWKEGYDWAVGVLLRKEETPLTIDALLHNIEINAFDKGCSAGIDKIINLGYKDNRI